MMQTPFLGSAKAISVFLGLFIALFCLVGTIKANPDDFSVFSYNKDLKVCSCATAIDSIFLDNTGRDSSFSVSALGTASGLVTYIPSSFYLDQNEQKLITTSINAPCDAKGLFTLETQVKTIALKKKIVQSIDIQKCNNIEATAIAAGKTCPCSTAQYEVNIKNIGSFVETYRVELKEEFAAASEEFVTLSPGKSKTIYVYFNLPCDIQELKTEIRVVAEKNNMFASFPIEIDAKSCYDYEVNVNDRYDLCINTNKIIPITINNNADVANSFELNINDPDATLEKNEISILGNDQGSVNLEIKPIEKPKELTLTVKSKKGSIVKTEIIQLGVSSCNLFDLELQKEQDKISCGEKTYDITLKNKGQAKTEYQFELKGPKWTSLSSNKVTIEASQTKTLYLKINAPCDNNGKYDVEITATGQNTSISKTLSLEVVTRYESTNLLFIAEDKIRNNYKNETIKVDLQNIGINPGVYEISIEAPTWVKFRPVALTMQPGEIKSISMDIAPIEGIEKGSYNIQINAKIKGTDIVYTKQMLLKLGSFNLSYWMYAVIGVVILAVILGVISMIGKKKDRTGTDKKSWICRIKKFIFQLVLVIIAIVLIIFRSHIRYFIYILIGIIALFVVSLIAVYWPVKEIKKEEKKIKKEKTGTHIKLARKESLK